MCNGGCISILVDKVLEASDESQMLKENIILTACIVAELNTVGKGPVLYDIENVQRMDSGEVRLLVRCDI
jgi:hypothetical protein